MEKLEFQTSKEGAWRSRLQRHAQRGKSTAAFCRDEAVSTATLITAAATVTRRRLVLFFRIRYKKGMHGS